ncbi:MAG TPA: chromate transporter [Acholeplasmataceae bacterium]|jgi:chromate transporter|nr:chromate transporter [Acholeplasmataceae bacterium]
MIIKLLELFGNFFLIGLFTIGGGYAMIPMIEDVVVGKGWLTYDELINFFAIAESTPGPFAVNTATLVGFNQIPEAPILGAIVTTTAVILPSFIIILIIAIFVNNFLQKKTIRWALDGIKATVVGLIFAVVYSLFVTLKSDESLNIYYSLIILGTIIALKLIFKKKIGPIPIIIISGFLGFIFYYLI